MMNTIVHRGPDEEGIHHDEAAVLGHRRLSIIDLQTGRQPLCNEDESKVIVFNGEIYNFESIRSRLLAEGHVFKTRSDTETILHLYERDGVDCLRSLRGMFAFVIWDKVEKKLFAARDRLGIKPFYYAYGGDSLVFGSEIKAVLASKKVARDIDYQALCDYITLMYIPGPKSIFRGIRKLPPGHYLEYQHGELTITQYWDVDFSRTESISENDYLSR
ncbi:MAG: asparagine synthetase B, partial [Chitinivibrionales bacterium]|nr:asparagine synthetase B [Chitinivibrionales bacterium]MBD3358754.1 asparagine synthetase B [Chitinivibrionales bacterium]